MYGRVKEPEAGDYNLCWEPTLEEGRKLLEDLSGCGCGFSASIQNLIAHLEKEIEYVEKEFESDVANYNERKTASELRTINEDQLQEAVKFLTAVWQGEIEATPVQVAAARCFMRAE